MKPASACKVLETIDEVRQWRSASVTAKVALVPTMGALHEGHMSLVRRARQENDVVCVSIFVNPLQFGANEDFGRYPRTFESDLRLCREAGVDAVFHPSVEELYPSDMISKVVPRAELTERLEGSFRPGHFTGVATVVCKLFNIVSPSSAYFGEKDFQQLRVVRAMVDDLDLPVKIVGVPTVRESDGLALSSRNTYLNAEQRTLAPILRRTLQNVSGDIESGVSPDEAAQRGRDSLAAEKDIQLQYLEVCDADSLEPAHHAARPLVILVAAKLGTVRLIDNLILR